MHAWSTLDQHFHWFLLSLKEAPNVSNKPPIQCNINQNNVTLVKQFKILNFPENREINNQFHLDFFTKQSPTCIMYIYIYMNDIKGPYNKAFRMLKKIASQHKRCKSKLVLPNPKKRTYPSFCFPIELRKKIRI